MDSFLAPVPDPPVSVVTGAAGFIGSHLAAALLAKGHRVIGIDNMNDYYSPEVKQDNIRALLESDCFSLHQEDINTMPRENLPPHIDYVFHLAGQPGVRSSWSISFRDYVNRNILATQRLLELIVDKGIRRFIFASSSSIYGQHSGPVTESLAPHPLSPYAASKLGAEGLCLAYSAGYGIPVTILRYFTVYGPRQRPDMLFHRLLKAAMTNTPVSIYGNGTQSRAFTYVTDAVDATIAAMSDSENASTFNISGGERATLNHCIRLVEKITGSRILRHQHPTQRGDPHEVEADMRQAETRLAYRPRFCLDHGIAEEWRWLQAQTSTYVQV
jgi:nucleoside-diphosphate-sugar epimerase